MDNPIKNEIKIKSKKYDNILLILINIFICFLILLIAYVALSEISFKINIAETEATILQIKSYKIDDKIAYYAKSKIEVNGQDYYETLVYSTFEEIPTNRKQIVYYNAKNPKHISSPDVGSLTNYNRMIAGFTPPLLFALLIYKKSKIKNNKDKKVKLAKEILLNSSFIGLSVYIFLTNNLINDSLIILAIYLILYSIIRVIKCIYYKRLKINKEYQEIKEGKYELKFSSKPHTETEIFFTKDSIIQTDGFIEKFYYKNIALMDVIEDKGTIILTIVQKNMVASFLGVNFAKKDISPVIDEIKKRVPNILIGGTKENFEKIRKEYKESKKKNKESK